MAPAENFPGGGVEALQASNEVGNGVQCVSLLAD